ncbi:MULTISPECIES: hypothetical protein [Kamptonema]|uniref:hypothetical protein n=1 Tax=Kamptonema TaxID=1501433 RepID=UPI0001DAC534|nr:MULTISPECIES: hypothetical protein [Kamptonema]CBN55438.1 hypothetical protein OSCI_1900016 [Kamptonema sp. PCC 6506]
MSLENIWTWADIVQLAAGFVLFMMGIWIGKKQEKSVNLTKNLTEEIKSLQTGLSELEMYEKIGVIGWGLNRTSHGEKDAAPALLYDCLAVLPILEFSGERLANNYIDLLRKSLDLLTEYSLGNKPMSVILIDYSLIEIKNLERKGRKELAEEMMNALARYLDSLKSKNKQRMTEISAHFLSEESVKQLLSLEGGDTLKIMKLLNSVDRKC